jgi:uncharacterized damage-inducible protein DinB
MKIKYLILLFLFLSVFGIHAQSDDIKVAFLEKWENSKNYLLEIAEIMPEEYYDFKPTERQRSFKEQLIHIKGNIDWLSTTYFTNQEYNRDKEVPKTKEEVHSMIKKAFENSQDLIRNTPVEDLSQVVDFFAGPKNKLQILNLLQDHVTHHRGQLIVYLNLKEIIPPKYIGW